MVAGTGLYFSRYVRPHSVAILKSPHLWLSALIALTVVSHGRAYRGFIAPEITEVFVNYNFMVFGFTIAALTIVFAVPTQKFVNFLSESGKSIPDNVTGPWEKALFIMSWNGVVHFVALICSLSILIFAFTESGPDKSLSWDMSEIATSAVFFGYVLVQTYALFQFLASLLSVYFFCAVFIAHAKAAA
jgi:hypothetical protein